MRLRAQSVRGRGRRALPGCGAWRRRRIRATRRVAAWRHTGRTGYGVGMKWRERKVQSARDQGNRRTLMAEAFSRAFKAQGYVCGMYYQMD